MFKDFFHKVSVAIREETARLRSVIHEQLDLKQLDPDQIKNHHK